MFSIFHRRADPEYKKEDGNTEEPLLHAIRENYPVGREEAMNIPTLAGCITKISETVSMIPIKLYKIEADAVTEIKDDLRVRILNKETGDTLDGVQFKRAMVRDYYLGKGGYAYINRRAGEIISLHYVNEQEISFMTNNDPIFKNYDILVRGSKYYPFQFIKMLRNSDNGRSGVSIITENQRLLSVAYHTLKFEENLVKTGGNKKGFITAVHKISDGAIKKLKDAWRKLYKNSEDNVVILNDGMQFKESSNTSVEMQLNENKKTNAEEICKIFSMSPKIVSGGASEEEKADFIQYCVNPALEALVCALNRDLLLEKEKGSYFFGADITELTKGDMLRRYQAYAIACKNGFMQADEVRYKENMPSLGLKFVKLGLQDVLYDPETGEIYTPNTDKEKKLGGEKVEN